MIYYISVFLTHSIINGTLTVNTFVQLFYDDCFVFHSNLTKALYETTNTI